MHGTAIGRKLVPRYYCATRRAEHTCDQPLVHTELVEAQLVEFIADFKPAPTIREEILRRLAGTTTDTADTTKRRSSLEERLHRSRDLYELGDLTRPEYMARRDAINTELATLAPGPIPTSTRHARYSTTSRSSGPARPTPPPSASSSRSSSSASGWTSSVSSRSSPSPRSPRSSKDRPGTNAPANQPQQGCAKSGSDGTRTRDLCRDRAAL
jgi:hypothetical protein